MSFFRKLNAIAGGLDSGCSVCGNKKKSGTYYTYDGFYGKKFCKQSCLNNFLKIHNDEFCIICSKPMPYKGFYGKGDKKGINYCSKRCFNKGEK